MIKPMHLSILFAVAMIFTGCMNVAESTASAPHIEGMFWQPDLATSPPQGNWELLGVTTFVPQWSVVQSKSWLSHDIGFPKWENQFDLNELQQEPWAKNIILGLAGEYNETVARSNVQSLAQDSIQIVQNSDKTLLKGYYFPVEADPTWLHVDALAQAVKQLPTPRWISIYSGEQTSKYLDVWLKSWLPEQTGVFFQDGVGVGTRNPQEAKELLVKLQNEFGKENIIIVLEAFRPAKYGQFRAAYPWEIIEQLKAYEGQRVYIFDGPHYMNRWTVYAVALWYKLHYNSSSPQTTA
ncbi:hypothetical protein CAP43_05600 [Acinetobacter junii]|nr:hypothetical protein [Acinetobacter junii]NKG34277.1 hypothetical protein [Acinetobacter junii]